MNKLTLLFFILLAWLQYALWFGKNGIRDYNDVNKNISMQQTINAQLKAYNDQLFSEINYLNNNEAIEECARNELHMIKPDETFYRLIFNISED